MKQTKDISPRRAMQYKNPIIAFTLIELLIVIALTGLLLALLLGPLVQAFGLTNRARALAEAQDATRFGMERLKRELSQAAYVFDNTNMPIVLPIGPSELNGAVAANDRRDPVLYPVQNGNPTPRPLILNAKIDFRPTATVGEGPNTLLDPTTDKPLGGVRIALPNAPGQRIVRYFVGLVDNLPRDNESQADYWLRVYYRNVYEFPRWDPDYNPFILYRAEFDPTDPNLVDQTQTNPFGPGGIHDPNFFYNIDLANSTRTRDRRQGNGLSYARNWRAICNPILSTKNLDVLAWRRGSDRQIIAGSPFQLQVSFAPSTVVGDAATPGFLANSQAEAPGAVPTLYTAKFGQWVYPFTITAMRGATEYQGGNRPARPNDPFGEMKFTFDQAPQANGGTAPQVSAIGNANRPDSLNQGRGQEFYWLLDSVNGKIHVFTANLAFTVDPARGRIETAFPPLATQNNIPLFRAPGARLPSVMQPGNAGNYGELIPLRLEQNTRDMDVNDEPRYGELPRQAGHNYAPGKYIPLNQGVIRAELFDQPNGAYRYVPIAGGNNTYPSPFNVFGDPTANPTGYRGIMMVPGSEMVMGPDSEEINQINLGTAANRAATLRQVTYYRIPSSVGSLQKKANISNPTGQSQDALYYWTGPTNYRLESDLGNYNAPYLQFDQPPTGTERDTAPGLPAINMNAPGGTPQGILQVSYLWQNNYSRNPAGQPINAQGETTTNNLGGTVDRNRIRPEADIMKLDYATRSLMNVTVGARVYDTTAKVPQSAQISDKITVNNVNR